MEVKWLFLNSTSVEILFEFLTFSIDSYSVQQISFKAQWVQQETTSKAGLALAPKAHKGRWSGKATTPSLSRKTTSILRSARSASHPSS